MTFEKQDVLEDFYAGNDKDFTITVYEDEDKTVIKDLTGAIVTWALFNDDGDVYIQKASIDSNQISIPSPGNGKAIVHLKWGDTVNIHGTFRHHANCIDANGYEETILTGKVRIYKSFAKLERNNKVSAYLEGGT